MSDLALVRRSQTPPPARETDYSTFISSIIHEHRNAPALPERVRGRLSNLAASLGAGMHKSTSDLIRPTR